MKVGYYVILSSVGILSTVTCLRISRAVTEKVNVSCTTPMSKPGTCVNLTDCPMLMNIIVNHKNNTEAMQFLRDSFCGNQSRPIVCCKDKDGAKFPNETVCGLTKTLKYRVVGGEPSALGSWPWIAALGYVSTSNNTSVDWLCAGSLISDTYVLTAAHCVVNTGKKKLSVVRLGELDLVKKDDGASPIDFKVDKVFAHEYFSARYLSVDIGLIKLAEKVTFTEQIRPICLPFDDDLRGNQFVGYNPFLAGWGAVSYKGRRSSALKEVQVEVTSIQECVLAYINVSGTTIDDRVICAGNVGKDACAGDSGGPLMLPRGKNFYLIGVVSYGFKCGEPGYPGVYTRVTEFVEWIDRNILNL